MPLISPTYKELNTDYNKKNDWQSANLKQVAGIVLNTAADYECESILDYGAGKHHLENMMAKALRPGVFRSYDPGVPGIDDLPHPADLVLCNSVLEHVEPECLDDVLADLVRCTQKVCLLVISCYPSGVKLKDGSSPHRIVESANWWMAQLLTRFQIKRADNTRQFFFKGLPLGSNAIAKSETKGE